MKYFKKLVGEHVYISPMNIEDADKYAEWLNNPEINKFLSTNSSLISIYKEKEYLEEIANKDYHYSIVKLDNDELIGSIAIDNINYKDGNAQLGIFIGEENNLGKGYGTEAIKLLTNFAFKELRLHMIYLTVVSNNPRAYKSYEKCGFKECGRLREGRYRNGEYIDAIYMQLINE